MHANLHINAISRSGGRSAVGASAYRSGSAVTSRSVVACASYRSGEVLKDERYEKTHDFTRKENVLHSEIITPEGAPDWMSDREKLWNAVEAGEKRIDAQLAKEIILTLPRNLDLEQHKEVVRDFVKENLTSRGLVADFAIHSPEASDGDRNPHAHIMFTLRPVEDDHFGKKLTGRVGGMDDKKVLADFRQSYERILNDASEKADSEVHFDLRSLKEKGIERQPQPKIGPKVTHLEKRGYETEWGKEVRQVMHENNAQAAYAGHLLTHQISYHTSRAVDAVRDDVAYKYYEAAYGENNHKDWYGNDERDRGGIER
ncbi:MobQ family relaxase [Larkinella sp. VNQ87]|uniref:MobQ family relaxase n=1 Tax=Larkinella sp. VNQ87 TaxID=3400921 RepID=UPI003BFDFC50